MSNRIYKHLVSYNIFGIRDKIKKQQQSNRPNKRNVKSNKNKI